METNIITQEVLEIKNHITRLLIHIDWTKENWNNSVMIIDDLYFLIENYDLTLIKDTICTQLKKDYEYKSNLIKIIEAFAFFYRKKGI